MANEVQKKESGELVDVSMFEGVSSGFEGTDSTTFKTPFVKILQALSPELKKSDSKYLSEAEPGLFCNSATQELYQSIDIIVLKVEHSLLSWKPNRGGFVGRHSKSMEESIIGKRDGLQKWDTEGNEIMDTIEFFCLNHKDPTDMFILSLSAASFKHARTFATRLRMLKANGKPVNVSWAGIWRISTVEETNEKGSWFTIGSTPEFIRFITKEEKEFFVLPAKEFLKNSETDYTIIESSDASIDSSF